VSEDVASRTPPGPQPATGEDATTLHPHRWRILSVTLLVGFMALLDVSIVNVAIPSMQKALDTSPGTIQWVAPATPSPSA